MKIIFSYGRKGLSKMASSGCQVLYVHCLKARNESSLREYHFLKESQGQLNKKYYILIIISHTNVACRMH